MLIALTGMHTTLRSRRYASIWQRRRFKRFKRAATLEHQIRLPTQCQLRRLFLTGHHIANIDLNSALLRGAVASRPSGRVCR